MQILPHLMHIFYTLVLGTMGTRLTGSKMNVLISYFYILQLQQVVDYMHDSGVLRVYHVNK